MLISQLFFDNEMFYRFEEMTQIAGIHVPICAGIMPITTSKQLGTTVSLSGSSVPKKLADIIANYDDKPEDMRKAGIEYAVNQILDLKSHGVNDIHLYSMIYAGDMKDILTDSFVEEHGRPDVIILDPPRAGIHPDVAKVILNAAPDRMVYVSCNPASQARDLEILCKDYEITAVRPVDMFPHTHHVENVVALRRR